MITQLSIQDTANTDLGTTATVELSKRQKRRNRKLLEREDTENPESKPEAARENVDMITPSSMQDNANTDLGSTATVELSKRQKRRNRKLLKREDTENHVSKLEVAPQILDMITQLSIQDTANTDLDTTATVELSKREERRNIKLLKEKNKKIAISETVSSGTAIIDANTGSKREEYMGTASGETGSGKIATPDANMVSEGEEHIKVANVVMGSNICKNKHVEGTIEKKKKKKSKRKKSTLGESLSPQQLEDMEVANGEMGSNICENDHVEGTIEKKEKKKRKKSNLDEILNPQQLEDMEVATKDRSTKVLEPDSKRSPEKKKKKLKKKAAKGELLNASENTQDSIIAKKDTVLEAETVSKVEECTRISRKTEKLIKKKGDEGVKAIDVIPRFPTSGKKLVVFDVNGLLVDIVSPLPRDVEADIYIPKRAIFKRPFLDGFLHFCFERFHVGIWSSRTKQVLDPVVNYVLGDLKKKLLFLWDATNCTSSGMKTLENRYKLLVFKDLRKIWEKNGPGNSWVKGTYNESNTLLFDDSPYKALLNPKHSGIFPVSYSYKNKNDNFLGPIGLLRTYLEGVAATDNLKMYVEQHPFGQDFIDENNRDWSFYSRVLKSRHY